MVKQDRQQKAFERLMLLIATLVKYPGVGCKEAFVNREKGDRHDALNLVQQKIWQVAKEIGIDLPKKYPTISTLRKDLEKLKKYHILESRKYCWGYYLGTGVMDKWELKVAFNALESQAKYQGDPQIKHIYNKLSQRLRGFQFEDNRDFFYPVRQNLNRAINWTDPEEMIKKGANQDTLFHQISVLETAIMSGNAIEISRRSNPYGTQSLGPVVVWPLQLIYYNIGWYLLYEHYDNGWLVIGRINRFRNHCQVISSEKREISIQKRSLDLAYRLLKNGWGLNLGNYEEQQLELEGNLAFHSFKVRFFPPITTFIQEGELRHPRQKIQPGPIYIETGESIYIDYCLDLPPRCLPEFSIWLQQYADKVVAISPFELVEKHRDMAVSLGKLYQC